ncbi:MAG TPA: histidine phosphatase family protein [Candidatus Lumbricidophila sp.]|nr:histidine phosphatase family protein [Candidatus Lumbricidophila sp.]
MTRHLYLVRHGEQLDAEHGLPDGPLSPRGKRQAAALAKRLGGVPFDAAYTSPLQRAVETAEIITEHLPSVVPEQTTLLFDCVPSGETPEMPAAYAPFFGGVTEAEIEAGAAQMADAEAEFLSARPQETHELLITHNFVIGWLVRAALAAPEWRWVTINQANCGLTVLSYKPGRAWNLVVHNDLAHLAPELRTGLPEAFTL